LIAFVSTFKDFAWYLKRYYLQVRWWCYLFKHLQQGKYYPNCMHVAKQINNATNTVFLGEGGGGKLTVPSFSKLDAIREIKWNSMQELQESMDDTTNGLSPRLQADHRQSVLLLDNTK
jgi:hypothetical protein